MTYDQPVVRLIGEGVLKTPLIIEAFKKIRREDSLPERLKEEAGMDMALPILSGQTNSQPYTVAFMLELLAPETGQKILDIGSGSGWTSSLLAHIVGVKGKVFAIERIPEVTKFGEKNASRYKFSNLKFICADGAKGLPNESPFDRIEVAASVQKIPSESKKQLKISGRLIVPTVHEDIRLVIRKNIHQFQEKIYPGFVFVPFVTE